MAVLQFALICQIVLRRKNCHAVLESQDLIIRWCRYEIVKTMLSVLLKTASFLLEHRGNTRLGTKLFLGVTLMILYFILVGLLPSSYGGHETLPINIVISPRRRWLAVLIFVIHHHTAETGLVNFKIVQFPAIDLGVTIFDLVLRFAYLSLLLTIGGLLFLLLKFNGRSTTWSVWM